MLIGFCGYPKAGKSSAARFIMSRYGFEHLNVGDPIKAMLTGFYRYCGLSQMAIDERLYGLLKTVPDYLLNEQTPTHAMQTLGKEWRDTISDKLFSDRWADKVRLNKNVVADGMRYNDEVATLRELNGYLVNIFRPGLREVTGHPAENQDLDYDKCIINDGTLLDLYAKLEDMMNELTQKKSETV